MGADDPLHVPELTAAELDERLRKGEPIVLLDVREPFERAFCAIRLPESALDLHVPMGQVPARLAEIEAATRQAQVVVYCHHGVRSAQVASWLAGQGIGAANLAGGIEAWSLGVDPAVPRY